MKIDSLPQEASLVSLQTVLDRLSSHPELTPARKRDMRSAVNCYAKLVDQPPAAIPLDLAAIRQRLDKIVPAWMKISRKRWANIRSDLAAAIDASGLRPMLITARIELAAPWRQFLAETPQPSRHGLSRFARWASLHRIKPEAVHERTFQSFEAELQSSTLVRNLRFHSRVVRRAWNLLAAQRSRRLRVVLVAPNPRVLKRVQLYKFPVSFPRAIDRYAHWASMPDPLAEGARARALSARSLRLQREHIHSAANAAVAAGVPIDQLTSLAALVEPEVFRKILRHLWQQDGSKLSAYTNGVAITLIAVAGEWVKAPADRIAILKALRKKLGKLPSGLTAKNEALLLKLDDPRVLAGLVRLPDRLWRQARCSNSSYTFIALQTTLAIDILIHAPARMQNLSAIKFSTHLHWPQSPRKPALLTFGRHETKTEVDFKHELPAFLADRLSVFRNEIAPAVIGRKPENLFITAKGRPRSQAAIAIAIQKTILRHLGVKMTPHQFRHLCAKIILEKNPGAYELVRQMLGHTSQKTAANFYAGINTLRAGRAHADLINEIRQSNPGRGRHRRTRGREE
jgi:integrase